MVYKCLVLVVGGFPNHFYILGGLFNFVKQLVDIALIFVNTCLQWEAHSSTLKVLRHIALS
jgi:hypothetical protein